MSQSDDEIDAEKNTNKIENESESLEIFGARNGVDKKKRKQKNQGRMRKMTKKRKRKQTRTRNRLNKEDVPGPADEDRPEGEI